MVNLEKERDSDFLGFSSAPGLVMVSGGKRSFCVCILANIV